MFILWFTYHIRHSFSFYTLKGYIGIKTKEPKFGFNNEQMYDLRSETRSKIPMSGLILCLRGITVHKNRRNKWQHRETRLLWQTVFIRKIFINNPPSVRSFVRIRDRLFYNFSSVYSLFIQCCKTLFMLLSLHFFSVSIRCHPRNHLSFPKRSLVVRLDPKVSDFL